TRRSSDLFGGSERFREHHVEPTVSLPHNEHETNESQIDNSRHSHDPPESPLSMTVPLVVLAVLSTTGVLVVVPYAISVHTVGHPENYFERTLSPIISAVPANETAERGAQSEPIWLSPKPEPIDGRPAVAPVGEAPNSATGAETPSPREISQERIFALISIAIAFVGIGIGWFMFQTQPLRHMPSLLEHKYYVDEIYDGAIINPIHVTSREGLWTIFDLGVIDGLIHSLGRTVVNFVLTLRYMKI